MSKGGKGGLSRTQRAILQDGHDGFGGDSGIGDHKNKELAVWRCRIKDKIAPTLTDTIILLRFRKHRDGLNFEPYLQGEMRQYLTELQELICEVLQDAPKIAAKGSPAECNIGISALHPAESMPSEAEASNESFAALEGCKRVGYCFDCGCFIMHPEQHTVHAGAMGFYYREDELLKSLAAYHKIQGGE